MTSAPLILVAAGGLGREAAACAATSGRAVLGFVDDSTDLRGRSVAGLPVLGGLEAVAEHPEAEVLLCVGKGAGRAAVVARLAALGVGADRFATLVASDVDVPQGCVVGPGSILLRGVVLTADVTLGAHVVAMPHVTFTHDDVVADFATFAAGVSLGGGVRVGERAYLGMNCAVREGVRVGADALVGMGAAVLADVPAGETWAGVPARPISGVDRRPRHEADGAPASPAWTDDAGTTREGR